MNKKGVSTLVAIVLLVLITACAIGIIWGIIMPLIDHAQKNAENQTAGNLTQKEITNPSILLCKQDCEKLGMEYMNILENPSGITNCFCLYLNGRGGIPVRLW
jgi:predicted PurR-regulated permease PerM